MPAATKIETWLDVMPAIPLDEYTGPAIDDNGVRCTVVSTVPGYVEVAYGRTLSPRGDLETRRIVHDDVRLDLNDPQGFGYAARWGYHEWKATTGKHYTTGPFHAFATAWWTGQITDDDRLALARACAEVARG